MENEHEEEEEEYEHEEEEEDTPSRPPTLEIGTRVTVYWSDDDQWYKGTVAKAARSRTEEEDVWIEYDDGDKDWMNIRKQKWRQSTKPDRFIMKEPLSFIKKQEKIAKLNVGSIIVVWWPKEKDYFAGTIVEIRSSEKKKPHHILNMTMEIAIGRTCSIGSSRMCHRKLIVSRLDREFQCGMLESKSIS